MQFKIFIDLLIMVYEPLHHALQKLIRSGVRQFLARFCFYFSLVLYILGASSIKQLFHECVLDLR